MLTPEEIKTRLVAETDRDLHSDILPYWMERMTAPDGGFYGRRDGHDRLHPDAPRGAVLNARILWSFAAAYRVYGRPEYLETAIRAKRQIIDRFYDPEYGGVYWSIAPDGTPEGTRKQFYALGFTIYGLAELARATGDAEALEYALKLFDNIETHSRNRERGGYTEALSRTWQPLADMRLSDKDDNCSKTMNTHLHIIEPYTCLLRTVPDNARVREAVTSLLRLFLDTIAAPEYGGHLGLFFDDEFRRLDGNISYGHDIEASWLLLETAMALGDPGLLEETRARTRQIALAALEGRQPDGSMIYERLADGSPDTDRHWWVQAEAVIGQLYLYRHHGMKDMLGRAMETWQYIKNNLIDNRHGEWFWSIFGDGGINRHDDKAGFWKCPYHNSRMCMEIYETLCNDGK